MLNHVYLPDWVNKAVPDYYTLFIQSWIPYNAWYNAVIAPFAGKTDRACIDYICANTNAYKDKIISLLRAQDEDGVLFRKDIANLHRALLAHTLPNAEQQITFSTIKQGGIAGTVAQGNYFSFHYKVERIPSTSGNENAYDITVDENVTHVLKYSKHISNNQNFDVVETDPNFIHLSNTMRKKIREYFAKVNPNAPFDVVMPPVQRGGEPTQPPHSLCMDAKAHIYFVEDKDKLAQVLIRLIYRLRCELFHGSINPTLSNSVVYEYLYKVQTRLIKELV